MNEGNEWAGPRRQSDSETAICCHGPEGLWFLILLATVVMNTGSDSQRHNQSQSTSFGSVTPLHGPPAVTHSFILTVCVWLHLCPHTVTLQSQLSSESCLTWLFLHNLIKKQPPNWLVHQYVKQDFHYKRKSQSVKQNSTIHFRVAEGLELTLAVIDWGGKYTLTRQRSLIAKVNFCTDGYQMGAIVSPWSNWLKKKNSKKAV